MQLNSALQLSSATRLECWSAFSATRCYWEQRERGRRRSLRTRGVQKTSKIFRCHCPTRRFGILLFPIVKQLLAIREHNMALNLGLLDDDRSTIQLQIRSQLKGSMTLVCSLCGLGELLFRPKYPVLEFVQWAEHYSRNFKLQETWGIRKGSHLPARLTWSGWGCDRY